MKKNFILTAVLLFTALCLKTIAQPNQQWLKNYGGLNGDSAYSIKQTTDGGYIIAGQSSSGNADVSGNHGGIDYWVAKLNGAGIITWQRSFGGSGTDIAKSVVQTADGGFIISGYSNSYDGNVTDHQRDNYVDREGNVVYLYSPYESWIVKLDNAGNISWSKSLILSGYVGGSETAVNHYGDNFADKIIQTSDGNYLIGVLRDRVPGDVFYDEIGYGYNFAELVKLSATGGIIWTSNLSVSFFGEINSFVETATGYSVLGTGNDFGGFFYGSNDVYLFKVSFAGANTAYLDYGGSQEEKGKDIQLTSDGGYIITGSSASDDYDLTAAGNHGSNDFWLLKLNNSGVVSWSKTYGGSASDIARSVKQTSDGSYFAAGESFSGDMDVTDHKPSLAGQPANSDYWIIKTNSTGDLAWTKSYGGNKNDAAYDIAKTAEGGLIAAGNSYSSFNNIVNKGSADWLVVKFIECGSLLPPTGPAVQNFCSSNNPVVADLTASGAGKKWYNVPIGGTALSMSTALVSSTYYVTQSTGGCESARKAVTVNVYQTPGLPVAAAQNFYSCNHPKVADLVAAGTGLKWYRHFNSANALTSNTALVTGVYFVSQTVGGSCESGRRAVNVKVFGCPDNSQRPVVVTNTETTIGNTAVIYPNPNKGTFKLYLPVNEQVSKATVQVIDMFGKIVLGKECTAVKGIVQETINAGNLPAAVYIVRYTVGGQAYSMRMVVEK